jgi:hypothetical protein
VVISAGRLGPSLSARATKVTFSPDTLIVTLEDGRHIGVPIVWFPRLAGASEQQREQWRLIGHGVGIHWDVVDEDISVEGLLATRDEDLLKPAGLEKHTPSPTPRQSRATRPKAPQTRGS